MKKVHIHTFGGAIAGNKAPPSPTSRPWDLCLNVMHLKDPHDSGLKPETQKIFLGLNVEAVEFISSFADFTVRGVLEEFDEAAVAINCWCGWARSVSLAEILASYWRESGLEVDVVHLHHDVKPPHMYESELIGD
ncbi:hypothetical protein A2V54_03395 [candidate division WWE3 bacterium RBG_19FT_COMBO_53_11]|uniref:Tyrosine specific protein phosphatases domain-containing protein n=1 Tax=candidate division WWE3 bacterium RBG_19FT_COMBO_53_11 TaxID=1802613 RepID=A0A1F4UHH4_UNCKA|nr:MAG: hypothetical protein A2155_02225 [candidate division WWE3 bacterium RBG_16_52_45]OGC44394.1 MAG: hypothetical protein A2V54_03395 [candidate division WWE3 bacterium RBG_19FT_COMBO_53_11]